MTNQILYKINSLGDGNINERIRRIMKNIMSNETEDDLINEKDKGNI